MHNVGEILYTTLPESGRIIPVQIVEVINIKSLSEEKTSYKVLIPSKQKKITDLSKFNKVFKNIEDIEDYLLNNAKRAISNMIDEANDMKIKYFDKEDVKESVDNSNDSNNVCINEDNYVKIDLGNGQVGKIKPDFIPKEI